MLCVHVCLSACVRACIASMLCCSHAYICSLILSIADTTLSTLTVSKCKTNSSKYCLCQEDKKEELKQSQSFYKLEQDGYTNIVTNVPRQDTNALAIMLDLARLDEGEGIDYTLRYNKCKILSELPLDAL